MTKPKKDQLNRLPKPGEDPLPVLSPLFEAGITLAHGIPAIVVDAGGKAWVVDPNNGTGRPVKFSEY